MTGEHEFDCVDCGQHVISFGPHSSPTRCAGCQWLADLPESMRPSERAELRENMVKRGVIGERVMADDPDAYLIWSHEHRAWWGPNKTGYVRRLSEAGRYSRADALMICTNAIPGARGGTLNELPVRLEDMLAMLRDPLGAEYVRRGESWE